MPNLAVDVDSWARSACYPRSTFYPLSDGPPTRGRRITRACFRTCSACWPRSQARLYSCIQKDGCRPSRADLRAPPLPFRRRPPQSNCPPGTVPEPVDGLGLGRRSREGSIPRAAPRGLAPPDLCLLPILYTRDQRPMPSCLDGLVVRSIAHELNTKLVGGKIDRVHQPENDEILLYVRNNRENFKVVLSSSSSNPRVYISNKYNKENPLKAPMFCMLLRKHLQGGIITDITQVGFERIIKISIESYDELKDKSTKNIYVEIMGRHSNIILTHDKDSTIIDSIKRVPPSVSRARQILPAMTYELPPAQDKIL